MCSLALVKREVHALEASQVFRKERGHRHEGGSRFQAAVRRVVRKTYIRPNVDIRKR